jgi:hypothetical protein
VLSNCFAHGACVQSRRCSRHRLLSSCPGHTFAILGSRIHDRIHIWPFQRDLETRHRKGASLLPSRSSLFSMDLFPRRQGTRCLRYGSRDCGVGVSRGTRPTVCFDTHDLRFASNPVSLFTRRAPRVCRRIGARWDGVCCLLWWRPSGSGLWGTLGPWVGPTRCVDCARVTLHPDRVKSVVCVP